MSASRKNGKFTKAEVDSINQQVEGLSPETVQANIAKVQLDTNKTLAQVGQQTITAFQELEVIKKAVEVKKQELERLYGVEKIAMEFEAAEQALNDRKNEIAREMAEMQRRQEESANEAARGYERLLAEQKQNLDRTRAQWEYDFAQAKSRETLTWEDGKRRRDIDAKLAQEAIDRQLLEREASIQKQEKEISDIRTKLTTFDAEVEKAVKSQVSAATGAISREHKHELEMLTNRFNSEKTVLDNTIASLKSEAANRDRIIEQLQLKLTAADEKVSTIATKALETAGNVKALADLQTATAVNSQNGAKRA